MAPDSDSEPTPRTNKAQAGEWFTSHEPRDTHEPGRKCEVCGAVLSIYNETLRCSLHKKSNILAFRKHRKR